MRNFAFTRGYPVMRLPFNTRAANTMLKRAPLIDARTMLFDLDGDPGRAHPLDDPALEADIRARVRRTMALNEAPAEAHARHGV